MLNGWGFRVSVEVSIRSTGRESPAESTCVRFAVASQIGKEKLPKRYSRSPTMFASGQRSTVFRIGRRRKRQRSQRLAEIAANGRCQRADLSLVSLVFSILTGRAILALGF
jgi:hypothetical protein